MAAPSANTDILTPGESTQQHIPSSQAFGSSLNYRLTRMEYLAAFLVCLVLFVVHISDIRWVPAIILFAYIDIIGYIPGLIAFKRAKGGRIPAIYHYLYNIMHSFVSAGVVAGLWALLVEPEWALLLIPLHLLGDRALLGNYAKPPGLAFE